MFIMCCITKRIRFICRKNAHFKVWLNLLLLGNCLNPFLSTVCFHKRFILNQGSQVNHSHSIWMKFLRSTKSVLSSLLPSLKLPLRFWIWSFMPALNLVRTILWNIYTYSVDYLIMIIVYIPATKRGFTNICHVLLSVCLSIYIF